MRRLKIRAVDIEDADRVLINGEWREIEHVHIEDINAGMSSDPAPEMGVTNWVHIYPKGGGAVKRRYDTLIEVQRL